MVSERRADSRKAACKGLFRFLLSRVAGSITLRTALLRFHDCGVNCEGEDLSCHKVPLPFRVSEVPSAKRLPVRCLDEMFKCCPGKPLQPSFAASRKVKLGIAWLLLKIRWRVQSTKIMTCCWNMICTLWPR